MAHARKKKRTHAGAKIPEASKPTAGHASIKTDPKSMVIRIGAGSVGPSVSQLATDVRRVMEPGTASRLRERRANRLKDYAVMAGPLGVTHLMLFSRSESGNTNLRVALTPRGPTLNFRVEEYSLCKDVQRAQRHPRGVGKEYMAPPLLVMNHFISPTSTADTKVPRHLETLATTIFQSLFPPINPQKTPLKSIKRVLLLNREHGTEQDDGSFIVNFRHYAITTRAAGVSRAVRRLRAAERLAAQTSKKAAVPNLGRLEDIADYMIGDGYATDATSGSELDTDNEIEVLEPAKRRAPKASEASALAAALQDAADDDDEDAASGAAADQVERRAVKLVELGPRMRLRLTKVEDGMCAGGIMWHEYVHKSPAEVKELEKRWEKRRLEKEARKKEQRANVERKKREREEAREKSKGGRGGGGGGEGEGGEMDVDDDDEEDEYVSDSDFDEVAAAAQGEGEDDMETNE